MREWMELLVQAPDALAEEASARLIESGAAAVERRESQPGASLLITHFLLENGVTQKLRAAEAALAGLGIGPDAIAVRNIEEVDWVGRSREMFTARAYGARQEKKRGFVVYFVGKRVFVNGKPGVFLKILMVSH